ncbi:acetyl-CoA carboxylase biotin carboxyl carrier protein [Clostridium botulinum]|uniref:Biotin carboxyl carrier protein of acetyl-CoA carboxylase n=1 Tax=Clostridium botulinum D str. 1873 TaxID=592027 RepID=A0A9P2LM23_CLOBO|nr:MULTISPECIES: acetyl-CoA carboxylase biotin carboxyl carrier protein [Clostridium]EES91961.1 acetyl-CoA carboxylase, biotin carboxyl carrier protein [Clostridium botulinum D str. 1873]MBO3441153.1 acetyl-CoA carboxylase biotin carboxyl carrier protein [Clostridium haemolyticum]MCD3245871.1 acetyl-CoA carboxylase biotin carboxyl carrier protein [Clostridium botulinum C]MCD3262173.1 acetyl-CoA carboxylase biotin carboxyl carrier protein [Clostridium botulinum C]NFV46740.1 acetyl-CoA carboxyla
MDYKGIQEIIKTMSNSDLTSLEIETQDIRIAMKKGEVKEYISTNKENITRKDSNSVREEETVPVKEVVVERIQETKMNDSLVTISSPIVGTFYSAPSPEDNPFVTRGSKVKKGETLCIIEAMKLMNEIEAEENCEIVEILVENEEMVEYGQPLFKVRI